MTLAQAADQFGIPHARTFQRYETGAVVPDAPFVLKAFELSDGAVTGHDFYLQRAEFLSTPADLTPKEAAE
nr:hypothetical protein [Rhizobium sp. RU36D]